MRLLMTSGGVVNASLRNELKRMADTDSFAGRRMLFCTTASNYYGGDMSGWVLRDLNIFSDMGFQIDICDLNGISGEMGIERLADAEFFFFEGGNMQWLYKCLADKGIRAALPSLMETRVWIGASAGSCVLCPTLANSVLDLFGETIDTVCVEGLRIVPFLFVPHLNAPYYSNVTIENIMSAKEGLSDADGKAIYAVDDSSAVSVIDGEIRTVGEGIAYRL